MKKVALYPVILLVCVIFARTTAAQERSIFDPHFFLEQYSNSLLYGSYIDHANLYWNPTFFGGRWYDKDGIKKIARNFYNNYKTISHRFEILSYGYNNEGNMEVTVLEYQTVKNRNTGEVSSTTMGKKIELFYWKGYYCYKQIELSLR